jgi:hypothetical protein
MTPNTRGQSAGSAAGEFHSDELRLLEAEYSTPWYSLTVDEQGGVVRLEYDLPPKRTLWRQCVAVMACCGAVFAIGALAVWLFAPADSLAAVGWAVVLLIALVGTFGPAVWAWSVYSGCAAQNPLLEWDRGADRVTRKLGPDILCPHEVYGLVALTAPDASGDFQALTQLQVVFRTPNGFRAVLLATAVKPAGEAFGPALRALRSRTGWPVWLAEREGASAGFVMRPLPEDSA